MTPAGVSGDGSDLPPVPRDQAHFDDSAPSQPPPHVPPMPPPEREADEGEEGRMGLLDHLEDLRKVLIQCLVAAGAAAVLCWFWSADLLEQVVRPVQEVGVYFMAPNDAFMARVKLAAIVGLFVVAPFIFFRVYGFVLPGLYRRERRLVTPIMLATILLFYGGVAFAYFVVVPQVVRFMLGFGTDTVTPLISVGSYLGFVAQTCLGFGAVFELPLLVLALSVVGVLKPRTLLRTWRYAAVIIVAVSAVLTPPDVLSQVMMAVPVMILYMGSVLLSLMVVRKRDKARAAAALEDD